MTKLGRFSHGFARAVLPIAAAAFTPFSVAQGDFPSRPITIVVPYPAGGTTDLLARSLQEPMQRALKQAVVIDNKPGAAAVLGTKIVAKAAADGYTLLMPNNGLVISPLISREAGFSPLRDFEPVAMVSTQPMILVVNSALPVKTVRELIDYAKANPGKLNYATAGAGSYGHLATELFARRAGIQMVHIPYKGQAPTMQAIVTGESHVFLSTGSAQMSGFIRDGRVRLLGVATPTTSALAPGAPPIADTVRGLNLEAWFGLIAPAGTPAQVVAQLNAAVQHALADPEVKRKFEAAGAQTASSTPQQMRGRLAEEYATWSRVVREADIRID
jgi:tripartite-type tricarboxylate transporter receptor subunit TctC